MRQLPRQSPSSLQFLHVVRGYIDAVACPKEDVLVMPNLDFDPALSVLVPASSKLRNWLLFSGALLALGATWFSPRILKPSAFSQSFAGMNSALGPRRAVLTITELRMHGWPRVELISVGDVPGAVVDGSWVIPNALNAFDDKIAAADYSSGASYLNMALRGRAPSEKNRLPIKLHNEQRSQLVVLWRITDCAQLTEQSPRLRMRTFVGTNAGEQLPKIASPGFDRELLRTTRACPDLPIRDTQL